MDRKWMSVNRLSKEYKNGVQEFIKFVFRDAENTSKILCPCLDCCYSIRVSAAELEGHLVAYGIDRSYIFRTKLYEKRGEFSKMGDSGRYASDDTDHDLWLEGHQNKEGVIDHPLTKDVADRTETLAQSVSQGELANSFGRQDILAPALPTKEHFGHLRGVGFGGSQSTIYGSRKRAKQDSKETIELKKMIAELYKEVEELRNSLKVREPGIRSDVPPTTNS